MCTATMVRAPFTDWSTSMSKQTVPLRGFTARSAAAERYGSPTETGESSAREVRIAARGGDEVRLEVCASLDGVASGGDLRLDGAGGEGQDDRNQDSFHGEQAAAAQGSLQRPRLSTPHPRRCGESTTRLPGADRTQRSSSGRVYHHAHSTNTICSGNLAQLAKALPAPGAKSGPPRLWVAT